MTPEQLMEYDIFWRSLVEDENGHIRIEVLRPLLVEFGQMFYTVTMTYHHLTEGLMSNPLTDPENIIGIVETRIDNAQAEFAADLLEMIEETDLDMGGLVDYLEYVANED